VTNHGFNGVLSHISFATCKRRLNRAWPCFAGKGAFLLAGAGFLCFLAPSNTPQQMRRTMQVKAKEQKGLNYSYSVTVPAATLEQHIETELQTLGQKVKIPGFRPGKVPMNILKQKYGKDVMGDVINTAVNKATKDVLEKNKLRPALQPDVKITDFKEGGDLQFDIEMEVLPEVPEIKFDKFTVDQYNVEIPESELTESLTRLAAQRKHLHKEEAGVAAKKGSVIKIDFLGKIDGTPFPGGAAEGHMLELGSNQFIPGFEDQLVGTKAGDKVDVTVSFPKDYHSKDLAGKAAVFERRSMKCTAYTHRTWMRNSRTRWASRPLMS
jgi:trigger factor